MAISTVVAKKNRHINHDNIAKSHNEKQNQDSNNNDQDDNENGGNTNDGIVTTTIKVCPDEPLFVIWLTKPLIINCPPNGM